MSNSNRRWTLTITHVGANLKKSVHYSWSYQGSKGLLFKGYISTMKGVGRGTFKLSSAVSYMNAYHYQFVKLTQNKIPRDGCKHPSSGYTLCVYSV